MRDKLLLKSRPELNLSVENKTDEEKFQNLTLRPIIKLQNDCIVSYFNNFALQFNKKWNTLPKDKKHKLFRDLIEKNQSLKMTFIGLVIGHFTLEELEYYLVKKSELNKRIIQIIKQRISSQFPSV